MHLIDTAVGHLGSSAIVGGSIPHAMGAAFASVIQQKEFGGCFIFWGRGQRAGSIL